MDLIRILFINGIVSGSFSEWTCLGGLTLVFFGLDLGRALLLLRSRDRLNIGLGLVWYWDCSVIILEYIWFRDWPLGEDSISALRCNGLMIVMGLPWGRFVFGIVLKTCLGIGLGLALCWSGLRIVPRSSL